MTLAIIILLVAILSFALVIRAVWQLVGIIKQLNTDSQSFRERDKAIIEAAKAKHQRV
ncbi:unnamed protein product [marine sediment metagenome]|uniref:Uncharacterized protein n=1 Tax=marine sediment metagenome TaxID=412755 RepID=X1BX03_9ZZZZ